MNKATSDEVKAAWLANSVQTKQQIEAMRNKANPYSDELRSEIEKYCAWLKQLYGNDFFAFKK